MNTDAMHAPSIAAGMYSHALAQGKDTNAHLHTCVCACRASLPKLTAVDVSAIAWALARWRFRPAPQWLGAFYTRVKWVPAAYVCTCVLCVLCVPCVPRMYVLRSCAHVCVCAVCVCAVFAPRVCAVFVCAVCVVCAECAVKGH